MTKTNEGQSKVSASMQRNGQKENNTPAKTKVSAARRASAQGNLKDMKHTEISQVLGSMKAQIAQALPKHLTPDRMIQMASTIITKNPEIAKCSLPSLMGAVMQASILGFKPVDSLGHCYFVPYGGHVQFQIGYKGYMELARRSGEIKMLYAEVVREGDAFEYELGLDPKLTHKPNGDPDQDITHAYAVAHYKDGGYNFYVLTKKEIEKLRLTSPMQKARPSGAWAKWYEEMAKAKVIKRLAKYMPMDVESTVATDEKVIKPDDFDKSQSGEINIEQLTDPTANFAQAEEVKEEPQDEKQAQNNKQPGGEKSGNMEPNINFDAQ